jgi:Na+/proline symporter
MIPLLAAVVADNKDMPLITAIVVGTYILILLIIARITSKKNDNQTFFTANRTSPWFLVAFGMIGTSISGVTFISIPGKVDAVAFSYFQIVIGYFFGYLTIAMVLLPMYYKLQLTSIYTYLESRFGKQTYKTGAFFFLLSRTVGSALRLLLAVNVFYVVIFKQLGVPFEVAVIISMLFILLYSIRGGVKTIIWTDTLQTIFLIASLILTIVFLNNYLDFNLAKSVDFIASSKYSKIFFWDYHDNNFFLKQFFSGMFITIAMTGLDQDMMQKNLTCRSLGEAKKNMIVFSIILIFVNLLFLSLGALMYTFAHKNGVEIPKASDDLLPTIARDYLPIAFKFIFLIGLTAATFASTDSALTALTTSFCVDFLNFNQKGSSHKGSTRYAVHIGFAVLTIFIVIGFHWFNHDKSIIDTLFKYAGYTYGPLLGLYAFGLFSNRISMDKAIPAICILSPFVTFCIEQLSGYYFPKYKIGFETLILNGLLVYIALYAFSASSHGEKKLKTLS